jgi:hypothetical protein
MRARGLLGAMLTIGAGAMLVARLASAEGALAVGDTGDVIKDGIAFGTAVDEAKGNAGETALARCKAFVKGSSPQATARCTVVASFARECFSIALDPKSGTPGAGWGVGKDPIEANQKAMKMCATTAGPARQAFCEVKTWGCDTKD